ncbi:hypothetical protein [Deinococcus sp. Leaf326]|uniref:hypothetical protein n=1 Tax=Deinococcus sp. Leaf326 TaxID=1736338 RepID=UPI0006FE457A|nr:hypothetical protein [Deinococcus sp. Leaf326]KQR19343.1 hypothetical protein ASF71_19595 [Deinococcus sp. Leaf326]
MKNLLTVILLSLLAAPAQAAGTPIKVLITGSGGQERLTDTLFIVGKRTRDATPLELAVSVTKQTSGGRISSLSLFVLNDDLKPSELDLLATNTHRVATSCFNLSVERLGGITAWLKMLERQGVRKAEASFGPMQVMFKRDRTHDGPYIEVAMFRTGQPGAGPWKNYCTN